jgi:hypothetical protein
MIFTHDIYPCSILSDFPASERGTVTSGSRYIRG